MRHIDEIWVHCSATRPRWWQEKTAAQKADEIRRWHVEDNGWRDIGYHFVIDRDGTVVEGRPLDEQGAHVYGHNDNSIGICLLGGHGSNENDAFFDHFTSDQDKALRNLIDRLKGRFAIKSVRGHNEVAAKACPGFDVQRWLKKKPPRPSLAGAVATDAETGGAAGGFGSIVVALFAALTDLPEGVQYAALALGGFLVLLTVSKRLRRLL